MDEGRRTMDERAQKNTERKAAIIIIVIALLAGLILYTNIRNTRSGDIGLSRRVFAGLIKGRASVQGLIDWPNLKLMDVDVGTAYSGLPDERERTAYRLAFIDTFSLAFRHLRGDLRAFINWRLYENSDDSVTVAADYKGKAKTILFVLSKDGKSRLQTIRWE